MYPRNVDRSTHVQVWGDEIKEAVTTSLVIIPNQTDGGRQELEESTEVQLVEIYSLSDADMAEEGTQPRSSMEQVLEVSHVMRKVSLD